MIKGMPIDAQGNMHATFFDYFNWFSLVGGVALTLLTYLHGLNYLTLKTVGPIHERSKSFAKLLYWVLYAGEVVLRPAVDLPNRLYEASPGRHSDLPGLNRGLLRDRPRWGDHQPAGNGLHFQRVDDGRFGGAVVPRPVPTADGFFHLLFVRPVN